MDRNHRLIIILIFLCLASMIVASCKSTKTKCDAYGIRWENPRIDSVSVLKDKITYLPFIPVMGSRELHMNTPEKGRYLILLKDGNTIVEERSLVLK